jgi:hypothetical protein
MKPVVLTVFLLSAIMLNVVAPILASACKKIANYLFAEQINLFWFSKNFSKKFEKKKLFFVEKYLKEFCC